MDPRIDRPTGAGLVRRFVLTALTLVLAASPLVASAEPAPEPWIHRCASESAEAEAGRAALAALSAAMAAPDARLDALAPALDALLERPCFEASRLEEGALAFDSLIALRTFWQDGGYAWLADFVTEGEAPDIITWPPLARATLDRESARVDDPLMPLLCPRDDEACGRETRGWVLRAEQAFRDHAALRDHAERLEAAAADFVAAPTCESIALAAPVSDRFVVWYQCEGNRRARTTVLPLGRWRAPRTGWLVMAGRRGHYHYCDETRAYDLATGAAYVRSWCGSLLPSLPYAARGPSDVDTDGEPRCLGSLPVAALREAAWSLFLGSRADEHWRGFVELSRPRRIRARFVASWLGVLYGAGGGGWSSDQTLLSVRWIDGTRRRVDRHLTWPDTEWEAEDSHSAALVRVAEAALEPGCSGAQLAACPALTCPPWE